MRTKQPYRNIQGRREGKAVRDLHYRREVVKTNPIGWSLTNAERNLYHKVRMQVASENKKAVRQNTNRLMRILLLLKRLFTKI